jgi:chorismate synthase
MAVGEPFFNSVESVISHLVFSIPAIKGIEFGSGFASAAMKGSVHNDPIIDGHGKTATNNAGGINGGISNGNEIVFRVAVKPTSSTGVEQTTFNFGSGKMESLRVAGRHDTCIALRMPVIIEAAAAIALADLILVDRGIFGIRK